MPDISPSEGSRPTHSLPKHQKAPGRTGAGVFVLKFVALMGLYYVLADTVPFDRILNRCLEWNAAASNGLLDVLGFGTQATGTRIHSASFAINVRRGCDAFEPVWFFSSGVLAFPAAWRRRAMGILAGALAIFAANILRISSLFVVGSRWARGFETLHLEVWPAALILLAVGLWVGWIRWAGRPGRHATA